MNWSASQAYTVYPQAGTTRSPEGLMPSLVGRLGWELLAVDDSTAWFKRPA
jgi:hypothetical protein